MFVWVSSVALFLFSDCDHALCELRIFLLYTLDFFLPIFSPISLQLLSLSLSPFLFIFFPSITTTRSVSELRIAVSNLLMAINTLKPQGIPQPLLGS